MRVFYGMLRTLGIGSGIGLVLLATGCVTDAPTRRAIGGANQTAAINDDALLRTIESNASKLCDAGAATTCEELGRQLEFADPVTVAGLPGPAVARVDLPNVYAQRAPGVLVIVQMSKCGKCPLWHHRGEASGFVLTDDGVCVTCRHVFEREREGYLVAADRDGVVFPITEVMASSGTDDVAVFHIDIAPASESAAPRLSPIPLRSGVRVGEDVSVIGHPRHHHYVLTRGIVSRRAERFGGVHGGRKGQSATPILNITAEFGVGSSGAPILDDAGNAVAMVASTLTVHSEGRKDDDAHKTGDAQMVMRTCIPAESILRLLGR
jgi:S1-C subfamily serine protease